jgi:glycosyltransferase involved in cell wall biosynthesis
LRRAGRSVPVLVAPLGADPPRYRPPDPDAGPNDGRPYFVFLGTIEPRKNHLLALHVWRRLAEEMGAAAPRLVLVGRRGWENEQVIDLVERCEPLKDLVMERGNVSDEEALAMMRGARALILPSFAEGYGLPVAEALNYGLPVLCSDLPALREVGGDVPEYLDPLDGLAFLQAVKDYAAPDSARRAAQLARLQQWRAPSWNDHVTTALDFIQDVTLSAARYRPLTPRIAEA